MKVADDLSQAASAMVSSPERFLSMESISSDEVKKRKQQAAAKSIERVIQRAVREPAGSYTESDFRKKFWLNFRLS